MSMNHGNLGTLASRAWKVVFGASVVGGAILAGCSASATGDEAALATESAVGACPGTDVMKCYFEPGTHIKTCDCYPGSTPPPPPPPPPTCTLSGFGSTPQGREVLLTFNTSIPVAMTVRTGAKARHDGVGTSHSFYISALTGDANNYASFSLEGCGAPIPYGYYLPSCGAEGQTACDGRCEKGLADHQIFGVGSCRIDGKDYSTPAPRTCSEDYDCPANLFMDCQGGGGGCRIPCGGHNQRSCYRLGTNAHPSQTQVQPCHSGLALLRDFVGAYSGWCNAESPMN